MNEDDRAELERLKRRQEALQMQLAGLTADIHQLASRLRATAQSAPEIRALEAPVLEIPPLVMAEEPARMKPVESVQQPAAVPPPLPPVISVTAQTELAAPVAEPPRAAGSSPGFHSGPRQCG